MNFKVLLLPLFIILSCAPRAVADDFAMPAPAGGRFLLLERQDPGRLLGAVEASTAPESGDADFGSEMPFSYSPDAWNEAREAVETGRFRREELVPRVQVAVSTEAPAAPEPQVEFTESGTTLSVTGRKVIALTYSGKKFLNEQTTVTRAKSLSLFEITQQMQVRMQGKVGQKITVNVDYDDTKVDKQDISVVYQGDANEVVQNVSFGDIDLSLPATEFVSYNKQLFGIRADLKTQRLKFTFVGSRTKGLTKTRQFTGNTQFQGVDILDTNYLRRKYYDVTFGNTARLPIRSGSERVYIDQQTQAQVDGVTVFEMTGDDLALSTVAYTGRFQLMSPGIDYVMDYSKGLLTFSRMLNPQDVVIIEYVNGGLSGGTSLSQNPSPVSLTAGGSGRPKIIKTPNDIPLISSDTLTAGAETCWNRELKTYYSIGQTNIVRDNGSGNFILRVQDLNRNQVSVPGYNTAQNNPPIQYPDTIEVDFEQGVFNLKNPFLDPDTSDPDYPQADKQIYSGAPSSKRIFRVEYSFRLKTFLLEPNIVLQSEVIRVDGKKLGRNEEYFIDYDSGFISFYYPERIGQDSKIDITYEVSPFGGVGNQSLVGGRISYDFGSRFSLGSTVLYQGGIKSNSVPQVTDLTNSMLVYEGDAQLKGLNLFGLKASLGAEAAQSRLNPNLNDFALVDNMEGVKQDDSPSMDKNYWFIAANPPRPGSTPADPLALDWYNENIRAQEINPLSSSEGTQQVLAVRYDFTVSPEVSIVFPLSPTGLDFSQKNVLELVVYGPSTGPEFNIHLGQINEDADNSGGQTFACASGQTLTGAPKSEDLNCDSQVSSSEDLGWLYDPGTGNTKRYGENNGRLDSQDLNKNGRLDPQDFTGGSFGYVTNSQFTDTKDNSVNNHRIAFADGEWHTLYIPLPITSTDTYNWNAIKQVRISLQQGIGAAQGIVKFARISAVGNTWSVQSSTSTGALQAIGVNNIDNPGYQPIYEAGGDATIVFNNLYGSVSEQKQKNNAGTLTEQTLAIDYENIYSTSTVYVYRKFATALDISQHAKLRFLVKHEGGGDAGAEFYLLAGDQNNFFKASVPLNFSGWRLITVNQDDLNKDGIPDIWTPGGSGVTVTSSGTPSLQQVPQFIAGIQATDANGHSGTVYFNELHVAEPLTRVGSARKVEGAFEVPGWFSFGGKHRFVDRNFQTPVTAIANQDNESQSGYLNITRLSFFPVNVTASRQITVTPNTLATGANNLVNSLQQGRVKKFDGTAAGSLNVRVLPKIGLNYTKGMTDYSLLSRKDDRDLYSANLSYSVPGTLPILPRSLNLNYSLGRNRVNYDASRLASLANLYDTDERTDVYGAKLTFTPWKGSSLNPGYSLQTAREEKAPLSDPLRSERYNKSLQQTADVNASLLFARWFNPTVNYSVTTLENNNLNITTVTVAQSSHVFTAGQIKTVNRTAQGGVSLTLNMNDLLPRNRLLRSLVLSSNYQIQDGDSWINVEKDYNSRSRLWLRDPLTPSSPFALRNSITLRDTVSSTQRWQPLEGFDLKGNAAPLKTLSLTNNFSNSVQRSEVTGTISRSVNRTFPDMVLSISQLESLLRVRRWAQGATMNLKYSRNINEAKTISLDTSGTYGADLRFKLLATVDTAFSYNLRMTDKKDLRVDQVTQRTRHNDATLQGAFDYKKFRFTPKADYVSDVTRGPLGVVTANTRTITPSLLIKSDFQLPKGLKLPFMKQAIIFTNRVVWTTTLSYAMKSSPITIAENNRLFSLNSSADYEAAKNLRLTFNAGLQRFWHKYLKQEEYISYQAGSTLTFQF